MQAGTWAACYTTWLLIKLTPKGVVFSFLFCTDWAEGGDSPWQRLAAAGLGSWPELPAWPPASCGALAHALLPGYAPSPQSAYTSVACFLFLVCAGGCSDCDMASGVEQCCAAHGKCCSLLRDRLEDAVSTAAEAAQYMLTSLVVRLSTFEHGLTDVRRHVRHMKCCKETHTHICMHETA